MPYVVGLDSSSLETPVQPDATAPKDMARDELAEYVQQKLVEADMGRTGKSPGGERFFTSEHVIVGTNFDGVLLYVLSHSPSGRPYSKLTVKAVRLRLEDLFGDVPTITIHKDNMGPIMAN